MKEQNSLTSKSSILQLHKEIVAKADVNAVSNLSASKTAAGKGRTVSTPTQGSGFTWDVITLTFA